MKYDLDKPFEVRILEDNDPDRPRFYIYTGLLDSDLFNADETILIIYLIASAYDNEINTINTTAISINRVSQKLGMSRVDVEAELKVGEKVNVIDGPFKGMMGTIDSVDMENSKLVVLIDLFGQETPVEVELFQVNKMQ